MFPRHPIINSHVILFSTRNESQKKANTGRSRSNRPVNLLPWKRSFREPRLCALCTKKQTNRSDMKRHLVREMCKKRREEKGDRGWGRGANELGFGIPVPYSSHNSLSSFCSAPQTNKTRRHGELLLNQNEHRNRRKQRNKHKKHTLTFNVICRCISPWAFCGTARGTCPTQAFKYLKC